MTSQGHPYARFRQALDRGNTVQAMSAATELEHVGLADALGLVLLLARDGEEGRFRRAAFRWHGRYCRDTPDVDPAEAQAVLAPSQCSPALEEKGVRLRRDRSREHFGGKVFGILAVAVQWATSTRTAGE